MAVVLPCFLFFIVVRQVVLQMRSNAVAWNPQEPMNFVCANEDTNLYTFDLRNLNQVSDDHHHDHHHDHDGDDERLQSGDGGRGGVRVIFS